MGKGYIAIDVGGKMPLKRLIELEVDIKERKHLLQNLSQDHWLYEMQRQTLESKQREYDFLKRQLNEVNNGWSVENKLNGYKE